MKFVREDQYRVDGWCTHHLWSAMQRVCKANIKWMECIFLVLVSLVSKLNSW